MSELIRELATPATEPADEGRKDSLYLPGLDGLRTIAFLMVFMLHAVPRNGLAEGSWWISIRDSGAYGVPLFFALSSFLITSLLTEEKRLIGTVNVPAFYVRRILRIWPLYFLIILLGWFTNGWLTPAEPLTNGAAVRFSTFSANFLMATNVIIPQTITQLWSVCVEEQFYLCWPVVIRFLNRKTLTALAMLMIAGGIGFRLNLTGRDVASVWFQSVTHIDCFAYGCLAAIYLRTKSIRSDALKLVLFVAAIAGIFVVEKLVPFRHMTGKMTAEGMITYSLIAAICALAVWLASTMDKSFLASTLMTRIGKVTYGLYCYHTLALFAVRYWIPKELWWLSGALGLGLTLALAFASYSLIEIKFLRLKSKFQFVKSGSL